MYTYSKTDWQTGEYFNIIDDYNRIKNNIIALHELSVLYFGKYAIIKIEDKKIFKDTFEDFYNNIEQNLEAIKQNGLNFPIIEDTKIFAENKPVWDENDINRIERTIEKMYTLLTSIPKMLVFSGEIESGEDW